MTYVQRLPRLPLPAVELSGRTVILLLVAGLHLLIVGLIAARLQRVPLPDYLAVPPDVTLLPPATPRPAAPSPEIRTVLETPRIEAVPPEWEVEPLPAESSGALDPVPMPRDEGGGRGPALDGIARTLPRQDPDRPLSRPPYPPTSVRLGETGVVLVNICVDETGAATGATLQETSGYRRLDEAALRHLRQRSTRLLPGTENGQPVPMCTDLRIRFDLE
jgi:protein TonB